DGRPGAPPLTPCRSPVVHLAIVRRSGLAGAPAASSERQAGTGPPRRAAQPVGPHSGRPRVQSEGRPVDVWRCARSVAPPAPYSAPTPRGRYDLRDAAQRTADASRTAGAGD